MNEESISKYLPLSVSVFHTMLALAAGEQHGYAIGKEVEVATLGLVRVGPTTLYRTLKNLVSDGWIVEEESNHGDQRRRVYALTSRGREIVAAEARRLASCVRIARERKLLME